MPKHCKLCCNEYLCKWHSWVEMDKTTKSALWIQSISKYYLGPQSLGAAGQPSQWRYKARERLLRAPGVVNKEAIQNLLYMYEDTFLCWLGFHVIIGCEWPTTNTLRLEWTSKSFLFHDTIHKALDVDTRSLQKCMGWPSWASCMLWYLRDIPGYLNQ